jgi:hypothetical protein
MCGFSSERVAYFHKSAFSSLFLTKIDAELDLRKTESSIGGLTESDLWWAGKL